MPSFPGPLPYDMKQPYEKLITELEDLGDKSDCGPLKIVGQFRKTEVDNVFCFDCYLHLQRWKERGSSAKERISIVVHIQETIQRQNHEYVLTRSTVHVNYLKMDEHTA